MSQHGQDRDVLLLNTNQASLFDRHGQALFAYVRLHMQSREDVKDITLEVFKIALEHHNLTDVPENEQLAWLRRVAHNKIVDRYRRTVRHPQVGLDTIVDSLFEDDSRSPEQLAIQREAHQDLYQTIRQLSTLQQQILRLRYGNGLSFSDIGCLLDRKEANVRKLLSRTLARLRTLYQRREGGEAC